jgi:hypothetical protein
MAQPADKHPDIRQFQSRLLGCDVEQRIQDNQCASCGEPATEFKDELSRREFTLSGMCQACQDRFFAKEESDID